MPPLARALVRLALLRLALLAAAFALATWAFGWWSVPVLAAAWGAARAWDGRAREGSAGGGAIEATLAALLAWAALLAVAAARGPVGALAGRLAGIMRVPPAALVLLTLLLPALLAGSAAAVAHGLTLTLARGSRST